MVHLLVPLDPLHQPLAAIAATDNSIVTQRIFPPSTLLIDLVRQLKRVLIRDRNAVAITFITSTLLAIVLFGSGSPCVEL